MKMDSFEFLKKPETQKTLHQNPQNLTITPRLESAMPKLLSKKWNPRKTNIFSNAFRVKKKKNITAVIKQPHVYAHIGAHFETVQKLWQKNPLLDQCL